MLEQLFSKVEVQQSAAGGGVLAAGFGIYVEENRVDDQGSYSEGMVLPYRFKNQQRAEHIAQLISEEIEADRAE